MKITQRTKPKNTENNPKIMFPLQGSASEALLVCLIVAKGRAIENMQSKHPGMDEYEIMSKLMAYHSDQVK